MTFQIKKYNKKENFETYFKRFQQLVIAYDICEEKAKALFLCSVGNELFKLLQDLFQPGNIEDFFLNDYFDTLKEHLCPKKNVLVERFNFMRAKQEEGENIKEFFSRI